MADSSAILNALHGVASRLSDDSSERDVETAFLQEGFFTQLGYQGIGHDLRSEWKLPDDRRPDYATLNDNQAVTAVYEFKNPDEDLSGHESQLFHYTKELKAEYGVLLNGREFRLFRRENGSHTRLVTLNLADATQSDARELSVLEKPTWDTTDPDIITQYVGELEPVSLEDELGREEFFETFRLEEGSPFANLVTSSMELLHELRDEQEAKFVEGAYDFWDASYASEPDDIPDSWEPFIDGEQSLRDFMFCLESGHALLARLLLAKASEDHDFFPDNRGLRRYFDELPGYGDEIDLDAYPVAAHGLIDDMKAQLVESLFEDDLFIWWTDAFQESTSTQHANPFSRFRDVAREGSGVTRVSDPVREKFSRAVADVFFSILKFDFAQIEGDPLGNLYQRYFDPETRKALGEFYTPQPVIDYIMDGVDYDVGVSAERLIDPACGSGTFLVEAVRRYKQDVRRYNDDPDWENHLTELCSRPHIVGLDIHPFAVLMAQIRFMVEILPEYREAKRNNPQFTIRRLPIFRTDSLRNERESTGADLGSDGQRQLTFDSLTEDNQDVLIPVPLPVEVDEDEVEETEGEFLVQRVRMPLFDTIQLQTDVSNFGEYFAALQGVLDVVKYHMSEEWWEYGGGLQEGISRYTTREYEGVEEFFAPYVDDILSTVQYLREEHGDGRLFKMLEDSVLSLVVKNYLDYEYVVGNPPYVRIQHLPDSQKDYFAQLYDSTTGNYDIYCPFYERGLDWLSEGDGRLGFITPNQFMVTDYGEGIRKVMLQEAQIDEIYDFRDSGVFEDATNYPAIVILSDEDNESIRRENQIRCVRVKANVDDDSGKELDEEIIGAVRDHRDEPGYSDDYIDVFDFPQAELDDGYWALMPPEELEVFNKLANIGDETIGDVTNAVFQGIRTSANKIYIVEVVDADRIESNDTGETVTVVPTGEAKEYEIETDLLRPFLQGDDVERWRGAWSGLHVIHPYYAEQQEDGGLDAGLYSSDYLEENLPKTWEYFLSHKDGLESREGGRKRGEEDWYGYIYPKNLGKFENPKIIQAHISTDATFMIDEAGTWYFTTAYGVLLEPNYREITEEVACQLNSKALDFYFKHITTVKAGGYYEYRSQYVEKLPCVVSENPSFPAMRENAESIVDSIDLESKTERFPEAYLGDFEGELDYIDYEWQTRRYPVDAHIQAQADGMFAVEAGRSDSITDPRMNSQDRAKYVHAAVDGRNVKSGEDMSIPIPRRDEDVRALLDALEEDRATVENTDIGELEAEIDQAVYEMFELTEGEREVIEDYLEVF
jgi:hypothetical protein